MMDSIDNWRKTHYASEVKPALDGEKITLMGWLREIRTHGSVAFLILADREGDCQVTVLKKTAPKVFIQVADLNREDVIAVKGVVKKSDQTNRGVEVLLDELKVLNKSETPLPLEITEKTPAEFDTRFDNRVLDLRKPKAIAVFKIKNQILKSARDYFTDAGFMEISSPKIIATATEGGADLFPISYFKEKAFLRQSPQLYKELMTACFEKVFEIGAVFRAEPSDTTQHLAEVTQIDIEMGFAREEDTWGVMEGVITKIYSDVKQNNKRELETLGVEIKVPETPFEKISYKDTLKLFEEKGLKLKFGEDIPPKGERILSEHFKKPVIVYEFPAELKPYYIHPHEKNKKLTYGFDLIMSGMELASGGRRVHSYELYNKMLKEKGLKPKAFEDISKFWKYGFPPHAGWAIGLDRLVMVLCDLENIREAVLFPRDNKRLTP